MRNLRLGKIFITWLIIYRITFFVVKAPPPGNFKLRWNDGFVATNLPNG